VGNCVEFPAVWTYPRVADEFVRQECRGFAGWRREEWAYSPLFLWTQLGHEGELEDPECLSEVFCNQHKRGS